MKNKFLPLSFLIIFALGILIYSNTFNSAWHFDDLSYIVNNPDIRNIRDIPTIWNSLIVPARFIPMLSFALNYHFGQTNVFGYHIVNILIHIFNSFLVLLFALAIFKTLRIRNTAIARHSKSISLFIALIFLTHPLQTQAVTYICQRFASLATLFYIATMIFYIKARLSNSYKYIQFSAAGIMAILGMLSKQIVITLPISILVVELLLLNKQPLNKIHKMVKWKAFLPIALIALIIPACYSFKVIDMLTMIGTSGSYRGEQLTSFTYFLTQARVIPTYIKLLFVPIGQNLLYDFQVSPSLFHLKTLLGFTFIASLFFIAFKSVKRNVLIAFGILWFFITLSVESSFITIRHVIFEHRVYLPSVGFCFVLVVSLYSMIKDVKKWKWVLSCIVIVLSVLTYQRNAVYKTEFSLWEDVARKSPHKSRPLINIGIAYSEEGEYDQALIKFNEALERFPKSTVSLNNRGIVYNKLHEFDLALAEFTKAIEINDNIAEFLNNRGDTYRHIEQYDLALADYNRALELNPKLEKALSNRGVVLSKLGQIDQSLVDFNRAIELNPYLWEAYLNRGNFYGIKKQYEKAISDFSKVINLNPNLSEVYSDRGNAFQRLDQYDRALNDFNIALRINPDFSKAYYHRAVTLISKKDYVRALKDAQKSQELGYDKAGELVVRLNQYLDGN